MTSKSKNTSLIILMGAIAIIAGLLVQQSGTTSEALPDLEKIVILPNSKPLEAAEFTDNSGNVFTTEDLKGYWNILFFGFTNCPDICPTTMRTMAQVKEILVDKNSWGNYRVIMVSVDPERDSVERLNNYVPYFDQEFIGLRGDFQTTTDFAKQMGILFFQQETINGFYDVDHSASLILVNPQAEMAGVITAPHKAEQISNDLELLAGHFSDDHSGTPAQASQAQNSHSSSMHSTAAVVSENSGDIDGLVLENAWIRPAPPAVPSMAAYFVLKNQSDRTVTLVGAQSPDFEMAMIHDTVIENEIAKMQHLDRISIAAGDELVLEPLGTHLMLMQPNRELAIGDYAEITLIAENGERITQQVEVKDGTQ